MLRRRHDENINAQNEEGRSKVYWNCHARTRSSNVQISTQSCSCFTRKCRRFRANEDDESIPTTQPRSATIQQPTSTNSTCSWTNSTAATRQHVQENDDENDDEKNVGEQMAQPAAESYNDY